MIKHLRLTLNLLSFVEYLCNFTLYSFSKSNFWRRCRGEQRFFISSEELNESSSLLQVTGEENRKICIAVTYKWLWASALESRNQKSSELPRFHGQSRGSAARKSKLLTKFLQGCLLCKNTSAAVLKFLYASPYIC